MPSWLVPQREYEVPRNIALLDTNVLISMFDRADARCADTWAAIDLGSYHWAVTHGNMIEAWNFLVGKVKRLDYAYDMMKWLLTPGSVLTIGDALEDIKIADRYSRTFGVDIVDAALMDIADRLTKDCAINPPVHVATYDVRDFLRWFGRSDLSFNVYDMRDLSSTTGE